ncbi:MAG: hypothetical protein WC358_03070 [Ignavibacteria bacterium]|jgi:hypothetical protein
MKIKKVIFSYDFIGSIIFAFLIYVFFPNQIDNLFIKDVYTIGISILSIVFSVFFAALAIIISSSDDEFVKFLINKNYYNSILLSFKITLFSLFFALSYSIILYIITSNLILLKFERQSLIFFIFFVLFFSYSLIATALSANDAIKYSKFRSEYLSTVSKVKSN